jgi:hypothetical protein
MFLGTILFFVAAFLSIGAIATDDCSSVDALREMAVTEKWALLYLSLANIAYANGTKV